MNCKAVISILCFLTLILPASYSAAYQATFHPRLTLSTEYTDNLERSNEDEEDDLITIVSPGFTLSIFGQTQGIDLSYDPAYAWYQKNSDNNTLRHTANLGMWKQATRNTRLYFNDAFLYTEDPGAEDRDADAEDRQGRDIYYTNTATVGMTNQFGPSDVFTLEYNYRILESDDDTEDDSVEHNPTAALTYYPFRNFGTETRFSYSKTAFDNDDDNNQPDDDYENYFGSIRLIQRLSRTFRGFVGYNYTFMDYVDNEDENYELYYPNIGFSYEREEIANINVSVGYLVIDYEEETEGLEDDKRWQVNGDISRIWQFRTAALNITGASGYDQPSFDQDDLGLRIYYDAAAVFNHEFLRDISYEINGGYRLDHYIDINPERKDKTTTAGVGLIFSRIEFMTARIDYAYRDVTSDESEEEYTENRFSFTIVLTPRNPTYLKR
jgi:hypothetical protein